MTPLAAIHVAKKELGLEDDDYRAVLERVTGKSSAGKMTAGEQGKVLDEFRRLGFVPKSRSGLRPSSPLEEASNGSRNRLEGDPAPAGGRRRRLRGKYAPKLQALWIAGWNLGVVRDRTDDALISFVSRQTGIDHVRFVQYADDAAKAIEALKGWMAREAGVDWVKDNTLPPYAQTSGFKIAWAQWKKLGRGDGLMFRREVMLLTGKSVDFLVSERDWHPVMNAFGERIRERA